MVRLITLTINFISWTTLTVTIGTSSLGHETGQHAMERKAIIKTIFDQVDKISHGIGGFVFQEFDGNISFRCGQFYPWKIVSCHFGFSQLLFFFPIRRVAWDFLNESSSLAADTAVLVRPGQIICGKIELIDVEGGNSSPIVDIFFVALVFN